MPTSTTFPNPPAMEGCACFSDQSMCVCMETERVLNGIIAGKITTPMTPEQREWCLKEIASTEGFTRKDYEPLDDKGLARGVLESWLSFARDKGLI